MELEKLYKSALLLLQQLIAIPSFSREEDKTAAAVAEFLMESGIGYYRSRNNVWSQNRFFDPSRPTILLNSHHDTVKPNPAYTRDPFEPVIEDGKLYGLGSNDAGGSLVSLLAAYRHFCNRKGMKYNLIMAATAEEEISGVNGIENILPQFPEIDFAIVGEPTLTQLAVAEKGLLVLDCTARGKAGHAAREEGENAIYKALDDMEWFRNYRFPEVSEMLGPVKMSVTIVEAGSQHNVVPAVCNFTVDIRVPDIYTHEEILEVVRREVRSEVKPRSMRMRSSGIAKDHPFVQAGVKMGKELYGSPTTSDQALIPAPSVKLGPGDSARSHMADEFIYLDEIREGIATYIDLLEQIL